VFVAQAQYEIEGVSRACPFAGKMFKVTLKFPQRYPFEGPTMTFETGKLYHPNVSQDDGTLCMDGIEAANLTVDKRATHVIGLLAKPNVGNPQDADCAQLMMGDIAAYEAKAKKWAEKAPDAPST
jgi:ubiquitin-protein ligase